MIATSIQAATVQVLHCVGAIRYQAKSEQNVRQDLIPRVSHEEAALIRYTMVIDSRLKYASCILKYFYAHRQVKEHIKCGMIRLTYEMF